MFHHFFTHRVASEWQVRGEFEFQTQSLNESSHLYCLTDVTKIVWVPTYQTVLELKIWSNSEQNPTFRDSKKPKKQGGDKPCQSYGWIVLSIPAFNFLLVIRSRRFSDQIYLIQSGHMILESNKTQLHPHLAYVRPQTFFLRVSPQTHN